ncbi:MAG: pilus (MSHA type) biogenesis protein MshL [Gammaproteobacteria bacterium]|nr:pilus (MSHA type) biogenesis protein MshL [Gammaproteobacteria bacterium]
MKKLNLLTCILLLITTGCAKQIAQDSSQQTRDSIRQEMLQASEAEPMQQPVTAPDEIMDQLVPATGSAIPGLLDTIPSEPRFDISVANAPADVFFMSLVADTDVNMVVHPSVSGDVSLDLKKVTVEDVMQLAREVYGYEYKKTDNGYIVLPARIQSRIYHVNYLNISRDGRSSMTVSSGQLASVDNNNDDDSSDDNDSSSSATAVESSSIKTTSKADFWSNLQATIVSIVGESQGRSVVVDPHAGLVIVRAMPGELRDVEAYLDSAQGNLQRQVILEAKIIEVRLDDSHQSGIDWAALSETGTDRLLLGQASVLNGNAALYNAQGEFSDGAALTNLADRDFANLFAIGGATDDFGFLLRLLDTQGDVQVLSSPRVSTVNNQKAVIKVGSDEFFVTDVSSTTTSGATTTLTTPSVTLTPFFSGIALDVTPQISQDNEVILHIHPSVSEVNDQTKNITIAGQSQQLPLALSTVRESDSVVRALSGQVVVIGGLMQNQSANDDANVPGLGDVPFLGNLFGQKRAQNRRSELVILLKPIVVNSAKTWSNYIKQSQQRIDQLQQPRPEAQ